MAVEWGFLMRKVGKDDNDMLLELGKSVDALYRRGTFGRVLKSEIDLLMFGAYARRHFQRKYPDLKFRWYALGPDDIRELSVSLKITESRVEALLEQAALADGVEDLDPIEMIGVVQDLVNKTRQEKADLKEGKLRVFVSNRVLRSYIEAFLLQGGGLPETSFHRGQLIIRVGDLLISATQLGDDMDAFLSAVVKTSRAEERQLAKTDFSDELERRTPGEVANGVARVLIDRLGGPESSRLLGELFGLIKEVVNIKMGS